MKAMKDVRKQSLLLRYEKVIAVLIKYGFEDIIAHRPFKRFIPKSERLVPKHDGKSFHQYTRYQRIRMVCEDLGTTFIKFAQIASNRPDVLPDELIEELSKFQNNAPLVPIEDIKIILKDELKRPLEELLEFIDYTPLASASMAQVHRARLLGGQEVVLKVQRPNIAGIIELDISILKKLARIVEKYFPQFDSYQPMELVRMFETSIRKELKFTLEASNLKRFHSIFLGHPDIYIPNLYQELSTERVLCMEFIEGCKINDLETIRGFGFSGHEIAIKGISLYFEQVFDHGFFHADPHPGNIFVLKTGKICFIDYGMMGTIMEKDKVQFADLLLSVHDEDVDGLKNALLRYSFDPSAVDQNELEYDILTFFENYRNTVIEDIESNEVMKALNSLFFDYKIKIPANLLLLLKALIIIEGVGLQIDPKYNIIENINPFVSKLLGRKYDIPVLKRSLVKSMDDLVKLGLAMPADIKSVINKIKRGKLHIEFEHKGLDTFYKKLEIISNRLSFALVLSSIILASSIMVISKVPPMVYNIPLPGFIGFVISFILSIKLILSIMRHENF